MGGRKGKAISMKEKNSKSVEEMAEELESRLSAKDEAEGLEEIIMDTPLQDRYSEEEASDGLWEKEFPEEEEAAADKGYLSGENEGKKGHPLNENEVKTARSSGKKGGKTARLPEGSEGKETRFGREGAGKGKHIRDREEDAFVEEFPENDWEDEEPAPMKPWVIAVTLVGIIVLAAVICAVLWHFTHLEKEDGAAAQSTGSSFAENSSSDSGGVGKTDDAGQESAGADIAASSESGAHTPAQDAEQPSEPAVPSASEAPGTATPAPQTTAQPSGTIQEPVSGTKEMGFTPSDADVTPKDVINLRSEPSTLNADNIVVQVKNGEILSRTGVNEDTGWTRIDYNGEILYGVTQYLTTDLSYKPPVQAADPNRVSTADGRIILFSDCSDNITPKEYVNLRTEPSTSEGEATVRCQISNGEVVHRTGYSPDAGWSRVEYNGEILYVVSSYMYAVE